jgi:O-antigen/teichoic acid export membrane protein
MLARVQGNPTVFTRRYRSCVQVLAAISTAQTVAFIVCGGVLMVVLYGPQYSGAAHFIGILAAMQAFRLVRIAPTLAALAKGDSVNSLLSNIPRALSLAAAFVAAGTGAPLAWIAACGLGGEVLALVSAIALLRLRHRESPAAATGPATVTGIAILVSFLIARWFVADRLTAFLFAACLACAFSVLTVLAFSESRTELMAAMISALHRSRRQLPAAAS